MHFIDLKSQYQLLKPRILERLNTVLDHGQYILGPEVGELEEKLAAYVGRKYCISCANGTDALLMALMALDIGPGDAVFTTTFSFIATAEVIALTGATPVFVDIDRETFNIDVVKLRSAIEQVNKGNKPSQGSPSGLKAKAIIPVDIFGVPADYDAINAIAAEFELHVIEDAAQSFGGSYKGKKACSFGDIAATSFFPAKPLGCYGDGGAIFTDNAELDQKLRSIRVHGQGRDKYENIRIGINGRLDTMQAAVLLVKLEEFDRELETRQIVASRYTKALSDHVKCPSLPNHSQSAWAQYSILSDKRDELMSALNKAGIPTAIYYPIGLHAQKAFSYLQCDSNDFPVANEVCGKVFSLPMHPYLSEDEQDRIVSSFL